MVTVSAGSIPGTHSAVHDSNGGRMQVRQVREVIGVHVPHTRTYNSVAFCVSLHV